MGADRNTNTRGGGALERCHGTPLETLAQLGDALGGVGATAVNIDAAELVAGQAAKGKRVVSMGADTKANTWGGGALEVGDLRLLEDGSERRGALGSYAVDSEAASKGQDGKR